MKIENYQFPKSSFLSMQKDMKLLIDKIMKNERLQKLLYYPTPDCLAREALTPEQVTGMFGKQIKIVPKLTVDGSVETYLIINFDNFTPNATNPEFRDNIIEFDIICHFDQWQLDDMELRPYKIAGELDFMLDNQRLTGIGKLEFAGASQLILTDEYAGICLMYYAIHGEEDKKKQPNPLKEDAFVKEFNRIYNGEE